MPAKLTNVSKRARETRPVKPEFGCVALLIGIFAGNIVGVIAQIALGGGMLVQLAGALAGCMVGGLFELVLYQVRKRAFESAHKRSSPNMVPPSIHST